MALSKAVAVVSLLGLVHGQTCTDSPADGPCGPVTPDGTWIYDSDISDEFENGFNWTKWKKAFPQWYGRAPGAFSGGNGRVRQGEARLTTKYEPDYSYPEPSDGCACTYQDFTTSLIMSKFTVQGGRFEIRAKAPAQSLLSSFWLQGATSEIAVMETVGASASNTSSDHYMDTAIHCFDESATQSSDVVTHDLGSNSTLDYHVYGIVWLDGQITYYMDDTVLRTVSAPSCSEEPMSIIFTLETIVEAGLPDTSSYPANGAHFFVDYIRSWQFESEQDRTCTMYAPAQFGSRWVTKMMKRPSSNRQLYDLGSRSLEDSIEDCATRCVNHGFDCLGFEYRASNGLCRMKNSFPNSSSYKNNNNFELWGRDSLCQAGEVSDCFTHYTNTRYSGSPDVTALSITPAACMAQCISDVSCLSFAYKPGQGRCFIFNFNTTTTTRNVVSNQYWDVYDKSCAPPVIGDLKSDAASSVTTSTMGILEYVVISVGVVALFAAHKLHSNRKAKTAGYEAIP